MDYLIQKYLEQNDLVGVNGVDYTLQDDGAGAYIKSWNLPIEEPSFTENDFFNSNLEQAKTAKISQLKTNRNAALEASTTLTDVYEYDTQNKVSCEFSLKSTGIGITEPSTIHNAALAGANIKYSCNIFENDENGNQISRKGYVLLNQEAAINLQSHIVIRGQNCIKLANDLEDEINACATLEEVNAININF